VPLNSPEPFKSIEMLANSMPDDCIVGAGTVLTVENVAEVKKAGGTIIIMPHSEREVIRKAKELGLYCMPGVSTPTEGFEAFKNGADAVKLFPAELIPEDVVKAWRAVFDKNLKLIPVGGINLDNMSAYLKSGASGFGLGGSLYTPGKSVEEVAATAKRFVSKWYEIK
jgi:2-dehydro-3-deoxyphosphogalactonate aldolase